MFQVYTLTSPSGKVYVGLSRRLAGRLRNHRYIAQRGLKPRHPLYRAISKYGFATFIVEVVAEFAAQDDAKAAEIRFVASLNSISPNGYNLSRGGDYDGGAGGMAVTAMLIGDPEYRERRRAIGLSTVGHTRRPNRTRRLASEAVEIEASVAKWRPGTKRRVAENRLREIRAELSALGG